MAIQTFRDLEVWQVTMSLAKDIYAIQNSFPKDERFGLCDQVRRSAVSVVSNIAEGFGREFTRDFVHFLAMSRGSLFELDTQLELAVAVGYVSLADDTREKMERVGMMLNALSSKLKQRIATSHEPRTTSHEP